MRGDRAAHEDKLLDARRKVGVEADGGGDVGQRAQRDQRQLARVLAREAQQGGHGVLVFQAARQGAGDPGSCPAHRPRGIRRRPPTPAAAAGRCRRKRHIAPHDFQDGQDIGIDHADMHIAGQCGDAEHLNGRVGQRQHDGLRVIDARVRIDD